MKKKEGFQSLRRRSAFSEYMRLLWKPVNVGSASIFSTSRRSNPYGELLPMKLPEFFK